MGKQTHPIYVELPVRASLDRLWQLSQDTELHPRWDLRFTAIRPAPAPENTAVDPQRFRYEFALPFHAIRGTGTSLGTRVSAEGHATSVLKFATADVLSPIASGAGYWRYVPFDGGVRFITGYNYQPGWGIVGKFLDARMIRPALGWATAVSFDRLRLWAEEDLDPAAARNAWLVDRSARVAGLVIAVLVLIASVRDRSLRGALVVPALVLAALASPASGKVPRAARCSRSTTDRSVSRAPSALEHLEEPV